MFMRILLFLLVIIVLNPYAARSQEQFYQNLSLGASAGKGYGIDASYGKRVNDPGGHDAGWDLAFSLWSPEYRFPLSFDNTRAANEIDYFDGAYIENTTENALGIGMGARYVIRPFAFGGMFDLIFENRADHYRNPVDNSRSVSHEDATVGGWTGTMAVYLADRITLNGFYGTRRGINVGLAWNIIDP